MKKIYLMFIALCFVSFGFSQGNFKYDNVLSAVKTANTNTTIINNTNKSTNAIIDSLHYDTDNNNSIGTGSAADFGVYALHSAATLYQYNYMGDSITSVKVFIASADSVSATELRIYSDTSTLVYSQAWTAVEGWNEVVLTTPLLIPATDLLIGYNITTTHFSAGCDAGPVDNNGNWMYYGGSWTHLTALNSGLTYNWNIRAMVDGSVYPFPISSCTPLAWNTGSIATGTSTASATFTLSNAASGTLTVTGATDLSTTAFSTTFSAAAVSLTSGQTYDFTFSFDPTAVNTFNETFSIYTNVDTINITLDGISTPACALVNTYPYVEDFEGGLTIPQCFTSIDNDGDTYEWQVSGTLTAHNGTNCATSASWDPSVGALMPDNFLVTPQFEITSNNLKLKFWYAAQDPAYPSDVFDVVVSTTGNNPADFTDVIHSQIIMDDVWTEVTLSLAAYNGQNIYIAFRHYNCTDWYVMKLDDISVDMYIGVNDMDKSSVNVYPNPTTGLLNVANAENAVVNIYNMVGEVVATATNVSTMDISNLENGTYIVKVVSDEINSTKKITLVK